MAVVELAVKTLRVYETNVTRLFRHCLEFYFPGFISLFFSFQFSVFNLLIVKEYNNK